MESEVPIGTVYQFFASKDGVVDTLALRYLREFEEIMAGLVEQAGKSKWEDVIGLVFDAFVEQYRSRPVYLELWLGRHIGPDVHQLDDENNEVLAQGLQSIIAAQEGLAEHEELLRACRLAISMGDAMLQLAFRSDRNGDESIIEESKRIERLYLADLVDRLSG